MKIVAARSKSGVVFSRQTDGTFLKATPASRAVKSFDAAGFGRLTSDWQVSRLSADAELQGKLETLRARSRDHEQNEPYTENFLKLRENNVVGHDGFTLEMKVVLSETIDPKSGEVKVELDKPANRAIERGWKRFCQRKNFLVTRDMHATEACKLIERTWQRDGDLLIRKVKGAPNEFGFALQLLEADYLDDRYIDFRGVQCNCPEERTLPNGMPFPRCERGMHEVRMGVELHGDWKFPVAYWLLANHPGDYFFGNQYATKRIRVPVEEIIHPFTKKRIEQTRGIPATVAAMLRLQMIGGMDEAALVAARAGAQKMGIITKEVPEDFQGDGFDPDALNGRTIDGAPGEFLELPMGFDVKSIDWKNPDNAYAPFQKTQLRGAAAALGVSYHSLAGDLESVNFSSGRLGHIEQREGFRGGQKGFIHEILLEAFPNFLEAAMLSGIVDLPFSRFPDYTDEEAICFHGRGFEFYDPTKDIEYAERAIALGIATRAEFAAEGSKDFEQVTAELSREEELRKASGLGEQEEQKPGFDPQTDIVTQRREYERSKSGAAKAWLNPEPENGEWVLDVTIKSFSGTPEAFESVLSMLSVSMAVKGWVTINGTHVLIEGDGTISKGPAGLVEHFARRNTITGRARQSMADAKPKESAAVPEPQRKAPESSKPLHAHPAADESAVKPEKPAETQRVETPAAPEQKPTEAAKPATLARKAPAIHSIAEVSSGGDHEKKIHSALEAINSVHGVHADLPKVRVQREATLGKHESGTYEFSGFSAGDVKLHPGKNDTELTAVHELGHYFDHMALGTDGMGFASHEMPKGPVAEVMSAINKSKGIKELDRMAKSAKGAVGSHMKYLAEPREKFARAYSQYIATKSGNPEMLRQLASERAGTFGKNTYHTDEEFKPIAAAFDKLFASKGWV